MRSRVVWHSQHLQQGSIDEHKHTAGRMLRWVIMKFSAVNKSDRD